MTSLRSVAAKIAVAAVAVVAVALPATAAAPKSAPIKAAAAKKKPALPIFKQYFVRVKSAGKRGGATPVRYTFRTGDSYKVSISSKGKVTDFAGGIYPKITATFLIRHAEVRANGAVFYDGTVLKAASKPRGKKRNARVTAILAKGSRELKQLVGMKFTGLVSSTGRHIVKWTPPAALKGGRGVMWMWGLLDLMRETTLAFPTAPVGAKAKYEIHLPLPFEENVALNTVTLKKVSKGKAKFTMQLGGGTIYSGRNSKVKPVTFSGTAKGTANLMTIVPSIKRKRFRAVRASRYGAVKNDVKEAVIKVGKIKAAK